MLATLGCHRVLLREYQTHDFAEFDILQEELNMYGIRRVRAREIAFVLNEIILREHLNIRVIQIDVDWTT
jgi:hypothetical protein